MRGLKFFIILFFILFTPNNLNASYSDINDKTIKVYEWFYNKIKNKYKNDDWLTYIKSLKVAFNNIKSKKTLNKESYKLITDLQKLNEEKIFNLELEKYKKLNEVKIKNQELLNIYKNKSYNNELIFNENWVWYAYYYKESYSFKNWANISINDLKHNWLYDENILVMYNWENIHFIKEYQKKKLITNDIIYWFPNKYELLKTIKNNKYFLSKDYDNDYIYLKNKSIEISNWLYEKEDIISEVYNYILENIEYTKNFSLEDYEIFSWIETFTNNSWVCEWYVELMNLMLWFNQIDSSILNWDVIDAPDFPKIWHAWVKIDDYYYDPTFDDPIWLSYTKTKEEYNYYKLPEDLFYTNRYNYKQTPEELKNTSLAYRKDLIKKNLANLTNKYKSDNYNLLKEFYFKQKAWLSLTKQITIEDLKNIYSIYDMNEFKINIDWKDKYIKNINYIILKNDIVENVLYNNNYDLSNMKIIRWEDSKQWEIIILATEISYYN